MAGDRIGAIRQQSSEAIMLLKPDETIFHLSDLILCNRTRLRCNLRGMQALPNPCRLLAPQTQAHIRLGVGLAERQAQAQRTRNLHASDLHGGGGAGLSGGGRSQAAGERRQRDDRPKSGGREHGSLSSSKPYSNPVYIFLR